MAHLSDSLFTTAIAVYALAMVGYTAEFAFSRVGRKLTAAKSRQLVGAGGPPEDASSAGPRAIRRTWPDRVGRWSVVLTVIGVLIHGASIAVRAIAVDAVP